MKGAGVCLPMLGPAGDAGIVSAHDVTMQLAAGCWREGVLYVLLLTITLHCCIHLPMVVHKGGKVFQILMVSSVIL